MALGGASSLSSQQGETGCVRLGLARVQCQISALLSSGCRARDEGRRPI